MDRKIFFRPERCLMCRSCVLACQTRSLGLSDLRMARPGKQPLEKIALTFHQGTPWAWTCRHCTAAPCLETCVTGSLARDARGVVVHHPDTCVGCGSCLLACPFSVPRYDHREERVAKCSLCPEEDIPPCVAACQSKALVRIEPNRLAWEKKKRFTRELRTLHDGK